MSNKPSTAKGLVAELNGIVAKATEAGQAAERARCAEIFMSCRGSNAMPMFEHLVISGASEQQANARIQDALAMASDALDIQSHHAGDGKQREKKLNAKQIYANRAKQLEAANANR
jgi:hypothetical protein